MIRQIIRTCKVKDWFLRKTFLIFPKNFLNISLDTIENQGTINLSSYSCKNYTSVIPNDSEVTFLRNGEAAAYHPFLYCVTLWKKHHHQISLSFILQKIFHGDLQLFCFEFFSELSSLSSVKCLCLMSCWSLIISWVYLCFQEGFQADSWNVISTSEVFLLGWHLFIFILKCIFF